jgi:hypothetical protein
LYFNGNAYFGQLKSFQKDGLGIEAVNSKNAKKVSQILGITNDSGLSIFRGTFNKNSKTG